MNPSHSTSANYQEPEVSTDGIIQLKFSALSFQID